MMNTPAIAFTPFRSTLQRPETSPLELAVRAASGNPQATSRLLRVVSPKVSGAVRAILGANHPDLDDAVQLALIGFVQALPGFRGDCEPAGYARVIAVRTAIAARKRERALAARRDDDAEPDETEGRPSEGGASWDADERRELVRDLLAELPDEQGETLALRVGLGWSLEEIARETGAPVNTVKSRLRLAKERLRARIDADPALRDARGATDG
jgi:RNA polymerase sigma-70 factor (ECF subfamily)